MRRQLLISAANVIFKCKASCSAPFRAAKFRLAHGLHLLAHIVQRAHRDGKWRDSSELTLHKRVDPAKHCLLAISLTDELHGYLTLPYLTFLLISKPGKAIRVVWDVPKLDSESISTAFLDGISAMRGRWIHVLER